VLSSQDFTAIRVQIRSTHPGIACAILTDITQSTVGRILRAYHVNGVRQVTPVQQGTTANKCAPLDILVLHQIIRVYCVLDRGIIQIQVRYAKHALLERIPQATISLAIHAQLDMDVLYKVQETFHHPINVGPVFTVIMAYALNACRVHIQIYTELQFAPIVLLVDM
jgi:hypothetical protein